MKLSYIIAFVGLSLSLVSCDKCQDCERQRKTYYHNIPSLSKIPSYEFKTNPLFKTKIDTFHIGELCGPNLPSGGESIQRDTTFQTKEHINLDKYSGGGIALIVEQKTICK